MLEKCNFKNFKSIEDCSLDLKPLTILTGPNSSGKSNLLEGIALIAQAVRSNRFPRLDEAIIINEFFSYPSLDFISYKGDAKKEISFKFHVKSSKNIKNKIRNIVNSNVFICDNKKKLNISRIGYQYSYKSETREGSQSILIGNNTLLEIKRKGNETLFSKPKDFKNFNPENNDISRIFFNVFKPSSQVPKNLSEGRIKLGLKIFKLAEDILNHIKDQLSRVYFLSTLRGSVNPTVSAQGDPTWIERDGRQLITILSKCFARRQYDSKANKIVYWAEKFGVAGIKSGYWEGGRLGSDFLDPILKTPLYLSLASFGSRQILTIITQLFWSEPGDLIMIEEPEISLHPESQVLLQALFSDAINEGKQIICSTHSPFLILALPRVIKSGKLSPNDVAVYQIEKTSKGTKAEKKQIDKRGYIKGWIERFAKVDEDLFSEYLEGIEVDELS